MLAICKNCEKRMLWSKVHACKGSTFFVSANGELIKVRAASAKDAAAKAARVRYGKDCLLWVRDMDNKQSVYRSHVVDTKLKVSVHI